MKSVDCTRIHLDPDKNEGMDKIKMPSVFSGKKATGGVSQEPVYDKTPKIRYHYEAT
jgi:hypothetical protein